MYRPVRQIQATRLRLLVSGLLVLALLLSQWWLQHHESDLAAHPDESSCDICLALQTSDHAVPDASPLTVPANTDSDPYIQAYAQTHSRPGGPTRTRGPPFVFS